MLRVPSKPARPSRPRGSRSAAVVGAWTAAALLLGATGCAPAAFPLECEVPASADAPLELHGSPASALDARD